MVILQFFRDAISKFITPREDVVLFSEVSGILFYIILLYYIALFDI